jgi:hypothetical protein
MLLIALELDAIGVSNLNDEAPSMIAPVLTKFNNLSIHHKWRLQHAPSLSRGCSVSGMQGFDVDKVGCDRHDTE